MDFDFSQEQSLLRDSVQKFLAARYGFDERRRAMLAGHSEIAGTWSEFATMGWLGLPFDEADGGLGGGPIETMILMECFGRSLVLEPYMPTVILAGEILRRGATSVQRSQWLPALVAGELRVAVAYSEPAGRYNLAAIATRARRSSNGWVLDGSKCIVLDGADSNVLIIAARTSGECGEQHGITLFAVAADAPGLTRRPYPLVDGTRGADLQIEALEVPGDAMIGALDGGFALLSNAIHRAIAGIGAEALGIMDALLAQTIDFTRNRVQFDQPIANFQVLQHRMVDMFMETEQTRSLVYLAAMRLAEDDPDSELAVAALKVQIGRAGRFVGQQAVQLHGAMGMTDEFIVGHYFKRLLAIDASFGNVDHHLQRFAALSCPD